MITLALDASTYVGTAAVFDGTRLVQGGETAMRGRDAERLLPLVLDVLQRSGMEPRNVGQIVCGAGPGSFTSLRIAASLAKGLAMGLRIGIRPVPSLGLIVAAADDAEEGTYLAALDALRGEFYVQRCSLRGGVVTSAGPVELAAAADVERIAASAGATLVGPSFGQQWSPHARGALRLPEAPFVELPSWEPEYGRKAEAQSRWEAAHGRSLPV